MLPVNFQIKVKNKEQGRLVILALYLARGVTVHGGGWDEGWCVFNRIFSNKHTYYAVKGNGIEGHCGHFGCIPLIEAEEVLIHLPNLARLIYADSV